MDIETLPDEELLDLWDTETDTDVRNKIVNTLQKKGLFPANFIKQWEDDTGAYPETTHAEMEFLQKLLAKREFAESLQDTWEPENDPCGDVTQFEVTPVQRFVANLMSPQSPYMSALLYHGVGVGKTCAAVQIAEAWLDTYPKDQIFLVAPPTIQEGFYRTIFDINKTTIASGPMDPNSQVGCTGNTYLELTGMTFEKDERRIERRIRRAINRRYNIMGYVQFGNYVDSLYKTIDPELSEDEIEKEKYRLINDHFSGKILIIDEAHNVRDIVEEEEDPGIAKAGAKVKGEVAEGKFMTPFLRKVVKYAQGLKLVLLTATPMYNSYKEIIFILNLLLANDKKATIDDKLIFHRDGSLRSKGKEYLGYIASRYVSFMRGENPKSFPIRLDPQDIPLLRDREYPTQTPRAGPIPDGEDVFKDYLPIVSIELIGDALAASRLLVDDLETSDKDGIAATVLGTIIQAGNCVPPDPEGSPIETLADVKSRLAPDALENLFNKSSGSEVVYTSKVAGGAKWLARENLENYSPKFAFLLDQLATAKGVCFVYIRTVAMGALPLALALEANGYSPAAGRTTGLLGDRVQAAGGLQCALCERKEKTHTGADHAFVKARYGLITGNNALTPNNTGTINEERKPGNENGALMKVIIGSQIAGEGVDLRYIREVHILDTWYHLNRTEQIIGRAIRFCSHSALPKEERNTTIHLYSAVFPEEEDRETGDLYSYRVAFRKAVEVGNVTRALKIRAIDCNLNHDAIIIRDQKPVLQIDSKGAERPDVDINDKPFTAICDWNDSCMYDCIPKIKVDPETADDSTYSEFAAKWRESSLRQQFRELFAREVFYESAQLWSDIFGDIPVAARAELFASVIDNKAFEVVHKGVKGYIKYCNGYYVFQPNVYLDLHIPVAIRAAAFPVKRDFFEPSAPEHAVEEEVHVGESPPVEAKHDLTETWAAINDWITDLKDTEPPESYTYPDIVSERITYMGNKETSVIKKYTNIVEMIHWFHKSVHLSGGDSDAFYNTVIEYLWDTWFTLEEQIELVTRDAPAAKDMVKDGRTKVGAKTRVYRYYNPKDATIQYICKGGPCDPGIVDQLESAEKDIPNRFLEQGPGFLTGDYYGFLTSHNMGLTFKINDQITPGTKRSISSSGRMCHVIPNISDHQKTLLELGTILETAGHANLELESDVIASGPRKIENPIRACTIQELVLRYMDNAKINDVRWFFRPVQARLIGYTGRFKRSTKGATTTAAVAVPKKSMKAKGKAEEEEEEEEEAEEAVPARKTLRKAKSVPVAPIEEAAEESD